MAHSKIWKRKKLGPKARHKRWLKWLERTILNKPNKIMEKLRLAGDLRGLNEQQISEIKQQIESLVNSNSHGENYIIEVIKDRIRKIKSEVKSDGIFLSEESFNKINKLEENINQIRILSHSGIRKWADVKKLELLDENARLRKEINDELMDSYSINEYKANKIIDKILDGELTIKIGTYPKYSNVITDKIPSDIIPNLTSIQKDSKKNKVSSCEKKLICDKGHPLKILKIVSKREIVYYCSICKEEYLNFK